MVAVRMIFLDFLKKSPPLIKIILVVNRHPDYPIVSRNCAWPAFHHFDHFLHLPHLLLRNFILFHPHLMFIISFFRSFFPAFKTSKTVYFFAEISFNLLAAILTFDFESFKWDSGIIVHVI